MKITISISKILCICLLLASLKKTSIVRVFFLFELFINTQEAFLLVNDSEQQLKQQVNLLYVGLMFNYVFLGAVDFLVSLNAAFLYIFVIVYAQTRVIDGSSTAEIVA